MFVISDILTIKIRFISMMDWKMKEANRTTAKTLPRHRRNTLQFNQLRPRHPFTYSPYKTEYSWSIIWEALWCYWKKYKSREYNYFLKDVENFKMDTSLENILISIQTLKSQVQMLTEQEITSNIKPNQI